MTKIIIIYQEPGLTIWESDSDIAILYHDY